MREKIRTIRLFSFLVFVLFMSAACAAAPRPGQNVPYQIPFTIAEQKIFVQIAKTSTEQTVGLSGRDKLTDQQGMLFDFRGRGQTRPGFWMKDMKFNLDFIWINQDRVIGITKNAPAPKNSGQALPVYYPPGPVDMVLEVNAGWAGAHSLKIGALVNLN